jgi:hypothetical protein
MRIHKLIDLPRPVLSLYPPFMDKHTLMLVDEECGEENPIVVKYNIDELLPGGKHY